MTSTAWHDNINRLAHILVHQVGVRSNDFVLLHSYVGAEELAIATIQAAKEAGARTVKHFVCDPAAVRAELLAEPGKQQYSFDPIETAAWDQAMAENGCTIQLRLDQDPKLWAGVEAEFGRWSAQMWDARGTYKSRAIAGGQFPWILFYVPTASMAQTIYPEVAPEKALETYWDAVFAMTLADQPDCLEQLAAMDATLHARSQKLNELKISRLHFSGPGTDLTVGLSEAARWLGGSHVTNHPDPRRCTVNLPTYEVYTTPDWRTVTGTVALTKDALIDGTLVSGAQITFEDGRATNMTAEAGLEALETYTQRDNGAAQMGEIALVGLDSPVAAQDRVFQSMLLDENAACHFAFGFGYLTTKEGGKHLSAEEADKLGVSQSGVHHDVMISDEHTTVSATTADGKMVTLLDKGRWTFGWLAP